MSTNPGISDLTDKIREVDIKYKAYSAEDFAQDASFIKWVKFGTGKAMWELFVHNHPEKVDEIEIARRILTTLQYKETPGFEKERIQVWENIKSFHSNHNRLNVRYIRGKFLRYAALLFLILATGLTIRYFQHHHSMNQLAEEGNLPVLTSGDSKLILAGGQEIHLTEKQSLLQFDAKGEQIRINRDSLIAFPSGKVDLEMACMIVPFGKRSEIQLADGTKVSLNAGSSLIFPQRFSGKTRKVYVKGEAYFDVVKKPEQPFVVSSGNVEVTVLGTQFNLKNIDSENEMEVVLVSGEVSLKENNTFLLPGKETRMRPNQRIIYNKLDNKSVLESNVNVSMYISWKDGLLEFNRESIINVFNRLSRYYNIRFETDNTVELSTEISGKLDLKDSLESVMKVVADAAPITYRIEKDCVFVNSKINILPMK